MQLYYVRKANDADLAQISEIFEQAKSILKQNGSPQWQNGAPTLMDFKNDIAKQQCYVLIVNQEVAGMATLQIGPDPNYKVISNGFWEQTSDYMVIHRVAIAFKYSGLHLNEFFFSNLLTLCRQNFKRVRIDTHERNLKMQHILNKFGFKECGVINVNDPVDPKRKAYELIMN